MGKISRLQAANTSDFGNLGSLEFRLPSSSDLDEPANIELESHLKKRTPISIEEGKEEDKNDDKDDDDHDDVTSYCSSEPQGENIHLHVMERVKTRRLCHLMDEGPSAGESLLEATNNSEQIEATGLESSVRQSKKTSHHQQHNSVFGIIQNLSSKYITCLNATTPKSQPHIAGARELQQPAIVHSISDMVHYKPHKHDHSIHIEMSSHENYDTFLAGQRTKRGAKKREKKKKDKDKDKDKDRGLHQFALACDNGCVSDAHQQGQQHHQASTDTNVIASYSAQSQPVTGSSRSSLSSRRAVTVGELGKRLFARNQQTNRSEDKLECRESEKLGPDETPKKSVKKWPTKDASVIQASSKEAPASRARAHYQAPESSVSFRTSRLGSNTSQSPKTCTTSLSITPESPTTAPMNANNQTRGESQSKFTFVVDSDTNPTTTSSTNNKLRKFKKSSPRRMRRMMLLRFERQLHYIKPSTAAHCSLRRTSSSCPSLAVEIKTTH